MSIWWNTRRPKRRFSVRTPCRCSTVMMRRECDGQTKCARAEFWRERADCRGSIWSVARNKPQRGDDGMAPVWRWRDESGVEKKNAVRRKSSHRLAQRLMPTDALRIRGRHNAMNALAALALCRAIDFTAGEIAARSARLCGRAAPRSGFKREWRGFLTIPKERMSARRWRRLKDWAADCIDRRRRRQKGRISRR